MNLYCLHGFLGLPTDWSFLNSKFPQINQIYSLDLLNQPCLPFTEWAAEFNKSVRSQEKKSFKKPSILGYSMGGRLALHALIENPEMYSCGIIVSANYGLDSMEERKKRLILDNEWSKAFIGDPWSILMDKWNNQSVFKDSQSNYVREESNFSRKTLSEALNIWSLGNQNFLKTEIENLSTPILWCVGEFDSKFLEIAKNIQFQNKKSKITVIQNAGHRVPWENPKEFILKVSEWLISPFS